VKKLTATLLTAVALVVLHAALDVSGTWEVEANFDDSSLGGGGFDCVVKQLAEKLTGTCSGGTASLAGEIDGQNIVWRVSNTDTPPVITTFTGTVDESGRSIKGRFATGSMAGSFVAGKS
jgi:hypothetical protein